MTHLDKERQKASFSSEKLRDLFYTQNGEVWYDRFLQAQKTIANDPVLRFDPSEFGVGRKETYTIMAKKAARLHELYGISSPFLLEIGQIFPHAIPGSVHNIMFVPTIANLGTEKQIKKFLDDAISLKIFGCYAQTELGHGSDVQSLETTATYDASTEEFILNTPTVSSTKWWPGELGASANHAVTHAQLYINGQHYGVQTFVVPIRHMETHVPLKGITCGDIGSKLGYDSKDNGFLRFDHVRIPRENMLSRYAKVSKSGEFSKPANDKIGYATMMYVRSKLIDGAWLYLQAPLTIAVRYAAFRKQFKDSEGTERSILDYQLQLNKILPVMANCYAMNAAGKKIGSLYEGMMKRINEFEDFSMMNDLHSILSGCKSMFTWDTYNGLEILRQACGGHGFSDYSGMPCMIREYSPNVTLEGDNTIMALQTARYLVKCINKATKGGKLMESVDYLRNYQEVVSVQRCTARTKKDFGSFEVIEKAMQATAINLLWDASQKLVKHVQDGMAMKDVWDTKIGISLVEATRAHIYYFTFRCFMEMIKNDAKDEGVKKVLTKLCLFYGINKLLEFPLGLAQSGYFLPNHFLLMKEKKEDLLDELRPELVSFTDAFGLLDSSLNSALGRSDGKVYETLYEWASKSNPMNDGKPNEGFMKYLKPVMGLKPKL